MTALALLSGRAQRGLRSPAFRWAVAPALLAWAGLAWLERTDPSFPLCGLAPGGAPPRAEDMLRSAGLCALMLAACMPPLLPPLIGCVAARTFRARRERAVGLFVAVYGATWLGVGAPTAILVALVQAATARAGVSAPAGLAACALAALWQLSAAKRKVLRNCHAAPSLPPSGAEADGAVVAFGIRHALRCAQSCAPVMFLPMLGGGGFGVTAISFLLLLAERSRHNPRLEGSAAVLLVFGAARFLGV